MPAATDPSLTKEDKEELFEERGEAGHMRGQA